MVFNSIISIQTSNAGAKDNQPQQCKMPKKSFSDYPILIVPIGYNIYLDAKALIIIIKKYLYTYTD